MKAGHSFAVRKVFQCSGPPSHFQLCWISTVARWRHNNSISRQPMGSFIGISLDLVAAPYAR